MTELRFPDPPLADDSIRLRPWSEADVDAAFRATQDALIPRFTRVPENQTEDGLRRFVTGQEPAREAGEALPLAIADAETDELLGSISLLRFEWPERRGEVGYWLAPWARGRGVATRAVRLLSRWALIELGLARLALHADIDNEASQRVAERCGFTREGVLRSFEERKGRRYDLVVFSLLPGDLP
jgi:RimJ/RimL family protein N-acetyltransferase